MEEQGRTLYVVRTWVPEEHLEECDCCVPAVHVPEVVAQPQVRRARKYRVAYDYTPAECQARYVTIYEFASLQGYDAYRGSEAAARLRQDYTDRYRRQRGRNLTPGACRGHQGRVTWR